ncbi:hypothetical protein Syn6312_2343 [Synechococcus sp. PCC 6312]|nr:hypothetical protein Syn6312_2343 [Synechococcus sp. PCC 6312]
MEVTRLSSIRTSYFPEALRIAHPWEIGQQLIAIDVGDGILLKPKRPFSDDAIEPY